MDFFDKRQQKRIICRRCSAALDIDDQVDGTSWELEGSGYGFGKHHEGKNGILVPYDRIKWFNSLEKEDSFSTLRDYETYSLPRISDSNIPLRVQMFTDQVSDGRENGYVHLSLVDRIRIASDLLSEESDIDFPICRDCADAIITEMNKLMIETSAEREILSKFCKIISTRLNNLDADEQTEELETTLRELKSKFSVQRAELSSLKEKAKRIQSVKDNLEVEIQKAATEEYSAQIKRNEAESLREFHIARDVYVQSKNKEVERLKAHLEKLNVLRELFQVNTKVEIPTLNGMRMSRIPKVYVEWSEINAAWGHALLLLEVTAIILKYDFQGYIIQPECSTSKIVCYDSNLKKRTELELFSSNDFSRRIFLHRNFENACVAFLNCMKQLETVIQISDPLRSLPNSISGGLISDANIRTVTKNEAEWTCACRYILENCSHLLDYLNEKFESR